MRNEKMFDHVAWWLYRRGVRPNDLTFLQLPCFIALAYVGYLGEFFWFGALQILVILIDGADGILARRTGSTSRRGHLLDSLFDILGIGITLWVVSFHHGAETFLAFSISQLAFFLLFVNFLVYIQNEIQGTKAITYTRGPVTIALYLETFYPGLGLIRVSLLVPLVIGLLLMVTRVDWRKRIWNWYQFLTAGKRHEYKATPRPERAALSRPPGDNPAARRRRPSATKRADGDADPPTPPNG